MGKLIGRKVRRGGFMTEYAVTLSVTAAAFTAIGIGVNRALQARVKAGADSYTKIQRNIGIKDGLGTGKDLVVNFGSGNQYENYATEQQYATYTERVNQTHLGNGSVDEEKVSDLTARAAGGFTRQHGAANRKKAADGMWE